MQFVKFNILLTRARKMASSLLVRLCCYLLLFASLSALKSSFHGVLPSLNALTVPGVPSSYVKRLFERPGPISVARRRRALRKSFTYLSILLLLSGDVALNPSPHWKYPCATCGKPVKADQDGLFCEVCMIWNHRLCVGMSIDDYFNWGQIEEGWVCPKCSREALPFWDVSRLDSSVNTTYSSSAADSAVSDTSSTNPAANSVSVSVSPSAPFLTIFTFNAKSLLPKLDELRAVCYNHSYDIICVTETWLSSDILDHELYLPRYSIMHRDRSRHGGGVAIYISNSLPFNTLQTLNPQIELLFVELSINNHPFTVGVFYRPPDANDDCLLNLYDCIRSVSWNNRSKMILCGDFNIDVSSDPSLTSSPSPNYLLTQLSLDFGLSQVVSEPTRITNSTASQCQSC